MAAEDRPTGRRWITCRPDSGEARFCIRPYLPQRSPCPPVCRQKRYTLSPLGVDIQHRPVYRTAVLNEVRAAEVTLAVRCEVMSLFLVAEPVGQ